ncbi:DMT family transporter [Phreatobacter stygius]|uniref:DMT family transporter n=1 Tax=Phreatobacter stygius TaxID=1940610 RepID=A0A4D7AZZ7_9HYPH|nr:DMT family transporter [Phreatobacter stygius]QCI64343.1 DMT family transporter [Phreatobacter stygius]
MKEGPVALDGVAPLPAVAAPAAARLRLKGIGLMVTALACFACLDTIAKWLNTAMDPIQVVWARYCAALVVVLIMFNPWRNPRVLVTRRPWIQAIRSALLFGSTAFNFIALQYLQLDQTVSIMFATPFLVAILAGPFLGEWIGPRRWAAVVVGFIGVIVVTHPWSGSMHWAMLLSLSGAFFYAVYSLQTRVLANYDSPATTSIYSVAFGAVVASALVPMVWITPSSGWVVLGMVATGAFGAIGHWLLIMAHGFAPAGVLSPFIYTQIIWMVTFGALFFGQVPAPHTLAGAGIVIASGLYLLYRERVVKGAG